MGFTLIGTDSDTPPPLFFLEQCLHFGKPSLVWLKEPHVFVGILSSSLENIKLAVIFLGVNFIGMVLKHNQIKTRIPLVLEYCNNRVENKFYCYRNYKMAIIKTMVIVNKLC